MFYCLHLTARGLMKESLKELIHTNKDAATKEYFKFLSFPSVSSEPQFKKDLLECVAWLKDYIEDIGFETELWDAKDGHPVLFGSYIIDPSAPTLLIYNHYDVQPCDPLELWSSPPFEPTIQDGEVYARGAQDNKGQCFYVLQALKALIKRDGKLPLNVKLCIEGEEENGSASLDALLKTKQKELKAEYLAIVDLGIPSKDTPAITLGIRGIITMDIEVKGSSVDLHSGSHGGIVFNPIHGLVKILSSLRDSEGRITIPGFYDDVSAMSDKDRSKIDFSFREEEYKKSFEAQASGGELKFSPMERNGLRPTIEINGINGGYTGDGFKTVIPAVAKAKLSCRLVPNQDPEKIGRLVVNYLKSQTPPGLSTEVHLHPGGGISTRTDPNSKAVQAFAKAYEEVFNKPCQFILSGASIPIAARLAQASQSEMVLVGLGLATDRIHAPNEHFGIDRIQKGALIIARAIELLANKD